MEPASKPTTSYRTFFNKLKIPLRSSKAQMLVFILVFEVIGYILIRTFAASPVVATIQAEQMTPSGVTTSSSGFMTNLTDGGTLTTPYLWTFSPGVNSSAGYFYANGKLLKKVTGPGPYVLRIDSGLLGKGSNKLGGSWDTTTGVHQQFPTAYTEKINNVAGSGFVTTLTNNMTINAPYIWAFDPGTAASNGYFYADGNQLAKVVGTGPYALMMNSTTLSGGVHKLGGSWDTTAGVHQVFPTTYAVTYNPGTSTASNYSIINDSTASGGQASKFGGGVSLSGSVSLSAAGTSFTVSAHGEQCSGAWPQMSVAVDGTSVINSSVTSTSWTNYSASLNLTSGTHTLTIKNTSGGSCVPNLYVDVTNFYGQTPPSPAPTVALSSSPSSVTSGQSSTLTWASTNATSCTASGAWSGPESTSGTASTGALNQNSNYTLACTGAGGTATATAYVAVSANSSINCTGSSAYCNAISYINSPAAFTPTRTVNVSSAPSFLSAISNLQAGDLVKATGDFSVPGETVIKNKLSAPAVIDLTGHNVQFIYSGGSNLPALWIQAAQNIRIYGGNFSTADTGGNCIYLTGSNHVTFWGFTAHDCGATGITLYTLSSGATGSGPVSYNDVQGEVYKMGQNTAWDPHIEKCSGLHGANIADTNTYSVDNNRVAIYVHDSACEGAGIEYGSSQSSPLPTNNTIYLECVNLTFVSTIQTGGNCFETWGYGETNSDIKYLEANNLMGRPYDAGGMHNLPNTWLSTDVLEFGRATNVRQNPRYATYPNWDKSGGTVFKDISPTP